MAAGSMGGGGGSGSNPGSQYFSLRWNNHPVNLVSVFTGLYQVKYNYWKNNNKYHPIRAFYKVIRKKNMLQSKLKFISMGTFVSEY